MLPCSVFCVSFKLKKDIFCPKSKKGLFFAQYRFNSVSSYLSRFPWLKIAVSDVQEFVFSCFVQKSLYSALWQWCSRQKLGHAKIPWKDSTMRLAVSLKMLPTRTLYLPKISSNMEIYFNSNIKIGFIIADLLIFKLLCVSNLKMSLNSEIKKN